MRGVDRGPSTFGAPEFAARQLLAAKAGRTVTVCIPAHDEVATVGAVVTAVAAPHLASAGGSGLVDEILVVDDHSSDGTGDAALRAGARVLTVSGPGPGGKGQAMAAGLEEAAGDVVVFLDGDVENTTDAFVTGLLGPLLVHDRFTVVKGFYQRPLGDDPTGGGRVTELMARPLIDVLFPELGEVRQPLAGETAAYRWVLEKVPFADGYGVELGLLVDVARMFGAATIAQVDLGRRVHRNRPLSELRPQAADVLRAALERAGWPAVP